MSKIRAMIALTRSERNLFVSALVFGALHHGLTIAVAAVSALMVGKVATGDYEGLDTVFWVLIVLVLPAALGPWLESLVSHMAAFRVLVDVRSRIHAAFRRLAPAYMIERRTGDLATRVVSDVEQLEVFFAHTLANTIVAVVVPTVALAFLTAMHWALLVAVLPILVALISVPAWLRERAERHGEEVRERTAELASETVDSIQGLREIVAFGAAEQVRRRLAAAGEALRSVQVRNALRVGGQRAAVDSITVVGILVVLLLGAYLISRGSLNPAWYPVAVVLAAFSFHPVATVVEVLNEINVVLASAGRVWDVLDAEPAVVDGSDRSARAGSADIEFEAVTFRYAPNLEPALRDLSFRIRSGETVALVGHSGAGKTTTTHLLLRHWDPDEGVVRVGGHDLRDLPLETLRSWMTVVPQDVYLFNRSLAANIAIGRPKAAVADIERAARLGGVAQFVAELPEGLDTTVGEQGAQLSGGQRQRVAFARAILKDAPILVLDEPVSNLDTESERALVATLQEVGRERTVIVVAHRLSTILAADRIIVLERGKGVESGTHDELVARGGVYARLVSTQLASTG
jgi:ABC-type multidrug transport system fused ATPase/permease subunit